jgi:hypothetical protein
MALTDAIRKNGWSLLSIGITVSGAILIRATVRYLYSHGLWDANSRLQSTLRSCGDVVFVLSVVTAVIALAKDESWKFRIIALLLGLSSVMFYVR